MDKGAIEAQASGAFLLLAHTVPAGWQRLLADQAARIHGGIPTNGPTGILPDDQEPPNPKQRVDDHRKLVAALVLEGAIVRLLRGGIDHVSRHGFARMTGSWPGEESD